LGVIKPYLLHSIVYDMHNEQESALYQTILDEFRNIPAIPSALVPEDSVFREFIGKND
jgi:hypothetical protein